MSVTAMHLPGRSILACSKSLMIDSPFHYAHGAIAEGRNRSITRVMKGCSGTGLRLTPSHWLRSYTHSTAGLAASPSRVRSSSRDYQTRNARKFQRGKIHGRSGHSEVRKEPNHRPAHDSRSQAANIVSEPGELDTACAGNTVARGTGAY